MSVLAAVSPRRRGTDLLLAHCAAVARPPAAQRLRAELGGELAHRLVTALSSDQRAGGVRGSSSP